MRRIEMALRNEKNCFVRPLQGFYSVRHRLESKINNHVPEGEGYPFMADT
jgi:hypothetical protein